MLFIQDISVYLFPNNNLLFNFFHSKKMPEHSIKNKDQHLFP